MKRLWGLFLALLMLCLPQISMAEDGTEAENLTAQCTYTSSVNQNRLFRVTDNDIQTHQSLGENGYICVTWTDDVPVRQLGVYFNQLPKEYCFTQYDAFDNVISEVVCTDGSPITAFDVDVSARRVELCSQADMDIIQCRVYSVGVLPAPYHGFCQAPDKLDYLLIATHPDDDVLFMGAIVPIFGAEQGYQGDIVYVTLQSGQRAGEALDGAWTMGLKYYPIFAGFPDVYKNDTQEAADKFTYEDVLTYFVRLYRQYRPDVVFTHDIDGEYGHWQHKIVSKAALDACSLAADASFDASSAELNGAWQVQKCYLHIYKQNTITLDTRAPLMAFDGRNAYEIAKLAYKKHLSQQKYGFSVEDGGDTGIADFGLAYSFGGIYQGGVFEGISPLTTPTPDPTATPTIEPTPTPDPTPQPTTTPTIIATQDAASPAPTQETSEQTQPIVKAQYPVNGAYLVAALAGLLLTALMLIFVRRLLARRHSSGKSLLICLLPLLLTLIFVLLMLLAPATSAEGEQSHFSDGEEIVIADAENGYWEYRNDSLGIFITRHNTTVTSEDTNREYPQVYYIAHIYMRNYDSFRAGFADNSQSGMAEMQPWEFSRWNKAVLAITGDNFQDEHEYKGTIMRYGRVYVNNSAEAVLAIKDDLTMQIFSKGELKADQMLEMGIRNTWSFGPWLIRDGVINENVHRFRVNRVNPRVGIGLIEQGHFVVIVVDGRQSDYSYGLTLTQFLQMFVDEGCVQAYNLDGGCSTGIVFMGESLNYHDGRSDSADFQRPWPDALMWGYSELVPSADDPIGNDGNRFHEVRHYD